MDNSFCLAVVQRDGMMFLVVRMIFMHVNYETDQLYEVLSVQCLAPADLRLWISLKISKNTVIPNQSIMENHTDLYPTDPKPKDIA